MTSWPPAFAALAARVGEELGVSRWVTVDQTMIDRFADCTGDRQWIHIDAERAKRESPYGTPVAHGYLTLSLIAALSYEVGGLPEGTVAAFNYGLDRVRFLAPVKAGSRVRLRVRLDGFVEKEPGRFLRRAHCTMEIEGGEKPALVADTLSLLVTAEGIGASGQTL